MFRKYHLLVETRDIPVDAGLLCMFDLQIVDLFVFYGKFELIKGDWLLIIFKGL